MRTSKYLAQERHLETIRKHGSFRLAVGYPNSYHVGMSSLSHLWVHRLALGVPGISVERFYADNALKARSLESGRPLGDFDALAFSLSFELDAVHLLKILSRAGIALEREKRHPRAPLVIVGGAVASINPLPISPAVDIFCLGAAEIIWPQLLGKLKDTRNLSCLLEELAEEDGFFIPRFHLNDHGRPIARQRRLEKRDRHFQGPKENVPASHIVTSNTEYRLRGLIEMSRGCPEKCKYCWVSHNYGRLRCYPADAIFERVEEVSTLTRRIGFVATAVGDHPELEKILTHCLSKDLQVALSSLRIPAMRKEILEMLAASGARSITIAPETGSDRLRSALGKAISNEEILQAVETAQRCGIEALKMYFIIGLPEESHDDIVAMTRLLKDTRKIMLNYERGRGRISGLHVGISILVPKPYTPYQRLGMISASEARQRLKLVKKENRKLSNLRLDLPSYRMARWQTFLSRSDTRAFDALKNAAAGQNIADLLRDFEHLADESSRAQVGDPPWMFISSAPHSAPERNPTPEHHCRLIERRSDAPKEDR